MMSLPGEDGFPHEGKVNFVNNVVNPSTGTIAIRGVFPNPLPPGGRRVLSPGMFVRIRLPIGQPHKALLVIDRALGSDQGLRFVYVVDDQHKIQYRRVTTGALQDDGLRVIEHGLNPGEWVVVGAVQKVRPLMEVDPDPTAMPTNTSDQEKGQGGADRPQPPPPGGDQKGKQDSGRP
jgi:multidrug efflux system membrane fusion protein